MKKTKLLNPKDKYREELNDIRWFTKRKSILARDMHLCTECSATEELEVHHIYYVRGNSAWDYPNNALITLCASCHRHWHDIHELEFRDKLWCKNRQYEATIKGSKNKKPKQYNRPKKKKLIGLKIPRDKLKYARALY